MLQNKNLSLSMKAFAKAAYELNYEIYRELNQDEDTSFSAFTKEYPFEDSFNEINEKIQKWVESFLNE